MITLASSVGQRLRRTAELVIGVAIGIGIGDAIILLIGRGPWQIGLVVVLAVLVATGGRRRHPAGRAVRLLGRAGRHPRPRPPASPGPGSSTRWSAAAIGLVVMTVLLPLNPLTVVRRAADPALQALADGLHEVAAALRRRRPGRGSTARWPGCARPRATFAAFAAAVTAARENVAFAPARWHTRGALAQYVDGAPQVTYALRNVRVLIRRVNTALDDDEPMPEVLPAAIGLLGDAVELLRQEWAKGAEPVAARERALRAAAEAMRGVRRRASASPAAWWWRRSAPRSPTCCGPPASSAPRRCGWSAGRSAGTTARVRLAAPAPPAPGPDARAPPSRSSRSIRAGRPRGRPARRG